MGEGGLEMETRLFDVYRVQHYAEIRHGFHFKDTDEYALYGVFYADNRDEPYRSYFRSNRTFEDETLLDHLRIDGAV